MRSKIIGRQYIKIKIKFEKPYLLCVFCVFIAFSSFWRLFGAIFCLTVDVTACHVLKRAKGRKTGFQICQPSFEVLIKIPTINRFSQRFQVTTHFKKDKFAIFLHDSIVN